jgi:hypothetical protein
VRWWVFLACAACGRLGFDASTGPSGNDAGVDASPFTCTTSAFDQGLPAGLLTFGSGNVDVMNGRLRVTVPGTNDVDGGVTTTSSDYAGHMTAIEAGASLVNGASTSIGWHQVTSRFGAHIEMDGTSLKFNTFDELSLNYTEYLAIPYDSVEHAWWRLREEGGVLFADVSRDGIAWNAFANLPGFDVADVRWDLGLGVYNGSVAPTEASFDNFVECVPSGS